MKITRYAPPITLAIFFIVFIIGCTDHQSEQITLSQDNILIYKGKINLENFIKLKKTYNEAALKPTLLSIQSGGGNGGVGIDMGYWIHANDIAVEVTRMCASSCANYIFAAGKQKILGKNALLLFHEGAYQIDLPSQASSIYHGDDAYVKGASLEADKDKACKTSVKVQSGKKAIIDKVKGLDCIDEVVDNIDADKYKESRFYESLGIDPNYPYYGQKDTRYAGKDSLYLYSLGSLNAMGLENILLKNEHWMPEQSPLFSDSLFFVEPDFPSFKISPAQLGMNKITQFTKDNDAILPSHHAWYFLDATLFSKHQNIVAKTKNREQEKLLLSKINENKFGIENKAIMVVCGQIECEIQLTHLGSYAELMKIDIKTMFGITPSQVKWQTGMGLIVYIKLNV
jgi:hypothetical protein